MCGVEDSGKNSVALRIALDAVESLGRGQIVLMPAIPARSTSARRIYDAVIAQTGRTVPVDEIS
jgi:hypothetical protein